MSNIFSEVYGTYYSIIAKLLNRAIEGKLTDEELRRLIYTEGYCDSSLQLLPLLRGEQWKIFTSGLATPVRHKPTMPLTILQKRWLKAVLLDERIQLFLDEEALTKAKESLQDIKPLFLPEQFVLFDRYLDGDNYRDQNYKNNFRQLLHALKMLLHVDVTYRNNEGNIITFCGLIPLSLEYSAKDDKFRLQALENYQRRTLKLNKIVKVETGTLISKEYRKNITVTQQRLVLEIDDERRTMERALLHFSDLAKETKKIDENHYVLTLKYDKSDEQEMLFRVLSFGPTIKVQEPKEFVELIRNKLREQMKIKKSNER